MAVLLEYLSVLTMGQHSAVLWVLQWAPAKAQKLEPASEPVKAELWVQRLGQPWVLQRAPAKAELWVQRLG